MSHPDRHAFHVLHCAFTAPFPENEIRCEVLVAVNRSFVSEDMSDLSPGDSGDRSQHQQTEFAVERAREFCRGHFDMAGGSAISVAPVEADISVTPEMLVGEPHFMPGAIAWMRTPEFAEFRQRPSVLA